MAARRRRQQELWNYQLYLIAGGLLAWHYEHVDAWLRSDGGWSSAALSRGALARSGISPAAPVRRRRCLGTVSAGGSALLPRPDCIDLPVAAVATDSCRPVRIRPALLAAADNSYGIYLCNAVFLIGLSALGYGDLAKQLPWPLAVAYAVCRLPGVDHIDRSVAATARGLGDGRRRPPEQQPAARSVAVH